MARQVGTVGIAAGTVVGPVETVGTPARRARRVAAGSLPATSKPLMGALSFSQGQCSVKSQGVEFTLVAIACSGRTTRVAPPIASLSSTKWSLQPLRS